MKGWIWNHQEILLERAVTLAYALVAILPFVALLVIVPTCSFSNEDRHGALRLEAFTASAFGLLSQSLALALAAALGASVLGLFLGVVLSSFDLKGRRVLLILHAFPLFLPPFLLALGWSHVVRPDPGGGTGFAERLLFGPAGVVAVLALCLAPVVTALVAVTLSQTSERALEAARLHAHPWRVATRVLLPHALPAAAFGAIVVFALAFSELGVPLFLGVRVYPAAVLSRLAGLDYAPGEAAALALPLLALGLGLLAAERWVRRLEAPGALRWQSSRAPLPSGRLRWLLEATVVVLVAIGLAPLLALAWRARAASLDDLAPAVTSLGNALGAAVVAATAMTCIALVAGRAIARRARGSAVLDAMLLLGFLMPAAVLGAGLIAVWNRPMLAAVYGTPAILVVGYVARYAVLGARTVAASVAQTSTESEEAAAVAGAGFVSRLLRVLALEHGRALTAAWFLAFVFCLRDLETVILYYPPGREPLTVRIFTLEANGPPAQVAAFALLQIAATGAILAAALMALGRREDTR
jgi:iron(III) transport system permease protein